MRYVHNTCFTGEIDTQRNAPGIVLIHGVPRRLANAKASPVVFVFGTDASAEERYRQRRWCELRRLYARNHCAAIACGRFDQPLAIEAVRRRKADRVAMDDVLGVIWQEVAAKTRLALPKGNARGLGDGVQAPARPASSLRQLRLFRAIQYLTAPRLEDR
jgi:hypothetical protein